MKILVPKWPGIRSSSKTLEFSQTPLNISEGNILLTFGKWIQSMVFICSVIFFNDLWK